MLTAALNDTLTRQDTDYSTQAQHLEEEKARTFIPHLLMNFQKSHNKTGECPKIVPKC